MTIARLSTVLRYAWASPATALGMVMALVARWDNRFEREARGELEMPRPASRR